MIEYYWLILLELIVLIVIMMYVNWKIKSVEDEDEGEEERVFGVCRFVEWIFLIVKLEYDCCNCVCFYFGFVVCNCVIYVFIFIYIILV